MLYSPNKYKKGVAMLDLGVKSCSSITFGNDKEIFEIPEILAINPQIILDEKEGVYRVSISKFNEPKDETTDALYQRFFNMLDSKMPFVSNMHIETNGMKLTFKLAYVMRYKKKFGIFYDIEATEKDIVYTEGKPIE
jgi:hypothetical protein